MKLAITRLKQPHHLALILTMVLFHALFIWRLKAYDLALIAHWLCYVILFICIYFSDDGHELKAKLNYGLTQKTYITKAFIAFAISFLTSVIIIYIWGVPEKPIYYLWQPLSDFWIAVWFFGYVFVQPFIDNIIYNKWLLPQNNPYLARYIILFVPMIRTYVETGVFIFDRYSPIKESGFMSLALWFPMVVSSLVYYTTKDESLSFLVDMMYRLSIVVMVILGMANIIYFIGF